jgi:asparagine synthase (glutamine-hydrolysing)
VFVPLHPAAAGRLPARTRRPEDEGYHTVRRRQYEDVLHEAYTPVFEVLDKTSAGQGIDLRFPFADRRLVEHSLALPAEVKQRDGWDRWVLRSAMEGRLPDPVRWRRGKGDLLPNLGHVMRTIGRRRLADELEDPDGPLARFVDRDALDTQLRRFDAGDSEPVAPLWTAACASAWLRAQRASRPPASFPTGPPSEA